jgi:hypothetical protein
VRVITKNLVLFIAVFLNKLSGVYEFLPESLKLLLKLNQKYQSQGMDVNEYRRRGEFENQLFDKYHD